MPSWSQVRPGSYFQSLGSFELARDPARRALLDLDLLKLGQAVGSLLAAIVLVLVVDFDLTARTHLPDDLGVLSPTAPGVLCGVPAAEDELRWMAAVFST